MGTRRHVTGFARAPRYAVGGIVVVLAMLALWATPGGAAIQQGTAIELATAMTAQPGLVTGATFVTQPDPRSAGVSTDALAGFPRHGSSFAILSTGAIASIPVPGGYASTYLGGSSGGHGDAANDVTVLRIDVDVPLGANCLAFDFKFLSEEYPNFIGGKYNDGFIAELDVNTWSADGVDVSAPANFAYDADGKMITVNSTGIGGMNRENGEGTAFSSPDNSSSGGATATLSAATVVTPGAHSVFFSIFDSYDGIFDTAVFLDNLRAFTVDEPGEGGCGSGAQVADLDVPVAPVAPGVTQPACEAGVVTTPAVEPKGTVGISYSIAGAVVPGGVVTVTANPDDGYVLLPSEGWTAIPESRGATFTVLLDDPLCETATTPPTDVPPTTAPTDVPPTTVPPTHGGVKPVATGPLTATGPSGQARSSGQLPRTGADFDGLVRGALTLLVLGGTAIVIGNRLRRSADPGT